MSVIEVQDLTKAFGGKRVLNGLRFSVERGDVFGFLGPNGAGKTTTMRILLGLLSPTAGVARVLGARLADHGELRKRVGVLLENNGLYDRLSAYENLEYYAGLYGVDRPGRRIEEMLEFTALSDRSTDMVGTFSAGMKRKLGLARAIIHEPEILFLDEPTSGLDPEAQILVRELILRLSKQENMTVFMSSHNLDEVQRVCSRVAILQGGTIQAFDTMDNLQARSGLPQFEIRLADPAQLPQALQLLERMPQVEKIWSADGRVLLALAPGAASAPLLAALIGQGIGVEEARRVARTLEEIYLGVVQQGEVSP